MISVKNRFRGSRAIEQVYKKGEPARVDALSAKATKSIRSEYRLAIVVSKKVHKSAVVRNRIRRRLYEQFRKLAAERNQPMGYDMVVSVFDEKLATIPSETLQKTCKKLLQKIEDRLK